MLTKGDLQEIRNVVREEVETEIGNVKSDLGHSVRMAGVRTSQELREMQDRIKNSEIGIKREIRKVQTKLEDIDNFLDKELMADRKRIVRIEEHLNFPKS